MSPAHARFNLGLLALYLGGAFAVLSPSAKSHYLTAGLFGEARHFAGYFPNLLPHLPVHWGIGAVVAAGFLYALLLPLRRLRAIVPFLLVYILIALVDVGVVPATPGIGALVILLVLIGCDGIWAEARSRQKFLVVWPARAWPLALVVAVIAVILKDPPLFVVAIIPFRPGWIPARRPRGDPPVVFFDGHCGLCQRSVDFLLREDQREILRFAPLQGRTAKKFGISSDDAQMVETMILADHGQLYDKSRAVLRSAEYLGGGWRLVAMIATVVPRKIRDGVYQFVSRRRDRFFGRTEECRVPLPKERARFLS